MRGARCLVSCWTWPASDFMQRALCRPVPEKWKAFLPLYSGAPAVCFSPPPRRPRWRDAPNSAFGTCISYAPWHTRASACEKCAVVGWALRPCARARWALQQKTVQNMWLGGGARAGVCVAQACFRAGLARWACATMPGGCGFSPTCVQGPGVRARPAAAGGCRAPFCPSSLMQPCCVAGMQMQRMPAMPVSPGGGRRCCALGPHALAGVPTSGDARPSSAVSRKTSGRRCCVCCVVGLVTCAPRAGRGSPSFLPIAP